jgi:hypothetical protein
MIIYLCSQCALGTRVRGELEGLYALDAHWKVNHGFPWSEYVRAWVRQASKGERK